MIHDNIIGAIGNTPVVKINKLAPPHVSMFVKVEAFNPMSSVKDRLAIALIKAQGWTTDFIPRVLNRKVYDEIVPVNDIVAHDTARAMAQQEGIFCDISSGATFAGALEVAKRAEKGTAILAMLPDTGERYLSTILFEGIAEGSDPEP